MAALSWSWRRRAAVLAGLVLPLALCVALIPVRTRLPNTDAALVLVAVVVVVAAYGERLSGLLASLSAAVSFDFFLTKPFDEFAMNRNVDIGTALLLLFVGGAVTEVAVRGRRHRLRALDDERYLLAIQGANERIESNASPYDLTTYVSDQLSLLLGLRSCQFEAHRFGGLPSLEADGRLRYGAQVWSLDDQGFPDSEVELLAAVRGARQGRFVLTPTPGVIPTLAARRCAHILCGQVAAALASRESGTYTS